MEGIKTTKWTPGPKFTAKYCDFGTFCCVKPCQQNLDKFHKLSLMKNEN